MNKLLYNYTHGQLVSDIKALESFGTLEKNRRAYYKLLLSLLEKEIKTEEPRFE